MRLLAPLALALALSGCKLTQEEWPDKSAEAQCKFAERCDTANFYFNYADVDECISDTVSAWEEFKDFYEEECLFDDEAAKDCLKALDSSCKDAGREYDELFEVCFGVWDCDDEQGTLPI